MRIGFIGLGDQGGPMARMILAAGFELAVWARRASIRAEYAQLRATVFETPDRLGPWSDVLCLCVTGDEDVRELLLDRSVLAGMRSGSIVAIHSTVRPSTCVELASLGADKKIAVLDLPVSGSGHAASARTLLVMAGGEEQALARVRPVLVSYAGTILHLGVVGTAMKAKLINNLLSAVNIGQAFHALALGRAAGVDPVLLRQAILAGTGRTFAMDLIERLRDPARAAHVHAVLRKDVALALESLPATQVAHWRPLAETGLEALVALAGRS
jgi:3-hydroxyisobutyrate dehydrogenase-like beta-hydroxyacid dehydrogenase